jgi:hypothetical protein
VHKGGRLFVTEEILIADQPLKNFNFTTDLSWAKFYVASAIADVVAQGKTEEKAK